MQAFPFIFLAALIAVIIFIVSAVKKGIRKKRSTCPKCQTVYTYPDDIEILASNLKFRKKEHKESVGNATISRWETIFYRDVVFNCKCSKCGEINVFLKSIDVYSSDDTYSQSTAEEYDELKSKAKRLFNEEIFKDKEIQIKHTDYENFY